MLLADLWSKKVHFSLIPQAEDCEALITPPHPPPKERETLTSPSPRSQWSHYTIFVFFIASVVAAALLGAWTGSRWIRNPDQFCSQHVAQYSPLMKEVDMSYEVVAFNGSLMKENKFRKAAGPEVDAAWASLGVEYRVAIVPPEEGARSGLTPDQVQVNDKYGGGFPANVEGLHHLHCLNVLRKSLYYNFDHYHKLGEGAFANSDEVLRFHVSHCLDILRQQLMCSVDLAFLGQIWWNKDEPQAYPDFNTKHKCKKFDGVRRWAEAHQAPDDVPPDYLKRPAPSDVLETMP